MSVWNRDLLLFIIHVSVNGVSNCNYFDLTTLFLQMEQVPNYNELNISKIKSG